MKKLELMKEFIQFIKDNGWTPYDKTETRFFIKDNRSIGISPYGEISIMIYPDSPIGNTPIKLQVTTRYVDVLRASNNKHNIFGDRVLLNYFITN